MKHLVVAILLLAGGEAFRRAAAFDDALSTAQEHLTTRAPADAPGTDDDLQAPRLIAWLPVVGPRISADVQRQRALAAYWRGDYAALSAVNPALRAVAPAQRAADPTLSGAPLRFIAANAMFRDLARQPANNKALVQGLDAVLNAYVSVLEADPSAVDAAYNFEFVSRLRGAVAAGRVSTITLPTQSDVHGEKGSPPPDTKPGEFNIVVPLSPEEREDQIEPQTGVAPQRKG